MMFATSLKMKLYQFIKRRKTAKFRDLQDYAIYLGYKADCATRRMRELVDAELIEPIRDEKKIIIAYRKAEPR
jgi:hypothetical protein